MSRLLSNVDIISDSWEVQILKLNELLKSHSTETITANTTYANTGNTTVIRNAQLWGSFGANNIAVGNSIRGGNINGLFANLVVTSNVSVSNTTASNINLMTANGTTFSYLNPVGVYLGNTAANAVINTSVISIQSNTTVNTSITSSLVRIANNVSSANITPISFSTGISTVNTTAISVGANVVSNATTIKIDTSNSNTTINATNVTIGNSTVNSISNSTSFVVSNSASYASYSNDRINLNGVYTLNTLANTDLGTNISTPMMIYSFPKISFSSGKFQVQLKNGTTTQISEMVLSHDGTDSHVTVYGTVATPAIVGSTSPLGTFSAAINGANVELMLSQTVINTSLKMVAHLIT